jgi:formylglycine-generating enzyme required for sulfatase activity/tetratricopeptide (TPR) repeat protein
MIEFRCDNCHALLQATDQQAGGRGTCPKCGTKFEVPIAVNHARQAIRPSVTPVPASPTVVKRRSNAGMAGLGLAIVSLTFCWFAPVGIPAAAVGLVLAGVSLLYAFRFRKTRLGFPIVGIWFSVTALIVAITLAATATGTSSSSESTDINRSGTRVPDPKAKEHLNRGLAYGDNGQYDEAVGEFTEAIELAPDYAEAYSCRGATYSQKRQYDEAIRDFTRAIELKPDDVKVYRIRGLTYIVKRDYDKAWADVKACEKYDGKPDPDLIKTLTKDYLSRGSDYFAKRQFDEAIRDDTKAIELTPSNLAYYARGTTYLAKGQLDEAIRDFTKAIGLKPDDASVYYARGLAYNTKGQLDEAIRDYSKAIELKPDDAEAYRNRGVAYHNKGQPDEAIKDYTSVIELKPDYAVAYGDRAASYYCLKDYDKAWADVQVCRKYGGKLPPSLIEGLTKASGRSEGSQSSSGNDGDAALTKELVLKELTLDLGNNITMKLVQIPTGKFIMGNPADEKNRSGDESPPHEVTISKPFYMGVYAVTQEQYEQVMGENPSGFNKGAKNPVVNVSWAASVEFCSKLSKKTGKMVMLPTEAQWEYACRAGSKTRFSYGDDNEYASLGDYAWYGNNSDFKTHPVGQKRPNKWGLYDMHGNVRQWCSDWYGQDYYSAKASDRDPQGPNTGTVRVLRGGSWCCDPQYCRSAYRRSAAPDLQISDVGFRVVVDAK